MRKARSALAALVLAIVVTSPSTAQQGRRTVSAEERARRQAEQERERQEMMSMPRPIEALNSVWIDELTWMEVRDAIAAGNTTAIIPTGGIEQNGPYLATGKHNYVLQGACDAIARKLGNALCTPVLKLVPEGDPENVRYPGTLSLRQETFRMVLEDVANSLRSQGFTDVVLIGDSGGNQRGLEETATALNERWTDARAYYIPEYYSKPAVVEWMGRELGIVQPIDEGLHDNYVITSEIMITDPTAVRYDQRVKAGKASINGLSIVPKEKTIEIGKKLLGFRVDLTVDAINAALSARQ